MKKFILGALLILSTFTFSQDLVKTDLEREARISSTSFEKRYSQGEVDFELYDIVGGKPIYLQTFNVAAAKSTRANHLNSGGSLGLNLNGEGTTYHVWDSGHGLTTHQELLGRVLVQDGSELTSNHGTHVIGTIIASGVNSLAKGMATQGFVKSYNWFSDLSEATTAANNGMILSNHSYGFSPSSVPDYYFGAYISNSRSWDILMYNSPYYLMCVAAGNDGTTVFNESPLNPSLPQYDKLTGHATSKNNLTVTSTEDASISESGDLISVAISNFSSQGPTDDLRIKPDIAGNGRGLYSTSNTSPTSYTTLSGTSMATPNVVGTLGLLQQYYFEKYGTYMKAATLKGLALHTADDAGMIGPDAIFGWGLLNSKRAAQVISNNPQFSIISELTLTPNETYTLNVNSDNVSELIASISWTDPSGVANTGIINLTTPVLVNDLDIRVIKNGTTHLPWKLTSVSTNGKGDNNVDPYERVDVDDASGSYTIQVTHKGSLTNSNQNFSLIVTGINNGIVGCNPITPSGVYVSDVTETSVKVSWNFVPSLTHELRYRKLDTTEWVEYSTSNNFIILNNLLPGTEYEVQVRSLCNSTYSTYSNLQLFSTKRPCFPTIPENIQSSQITGVSGVITWNSVDYATYNVLYKKTTEQFGIQVSSNTNTRLLAGLSPDTTYEVKVRSKCESGVGEWSSPIFFTTGPACDLLPPSSITSSDISTSTATIYWSTVSNVTSYNVRCKPVTATTYSLFSGTLQPTQTITNLLSGTQYEVQVQSKCDNGSLSEWSTIYYFTTLSGTCIPTPVTNLSISNITNTSAYLNWDGSNPSYIVRWKRVGSIITSSTIISQPFVTMNNLEEASTYDVEVLGRCENGNTSTAVTLSFTTGGVVVPPPPVCSPTVPTNISSTLNGFVTWDIVPLATYEIRFTKAKGKPSYTTFSTTTNSYQLNLQSNTRYKIEVRSKCGNQFSAWGSVTITTSNTTNEYSNQTSSYPNPVTDILNIRHEGYITLYNYLGAIVYESDYVQEINMSPYPVGMYFLKVGDSIEKIIKK
jgi:hypothetical protein